MTTPLDTTTDVDFCHHLATVADALSIRHFRTEVDVTTKIDGTPVSAADLAVEAALLALIERHRPDDGVLSEEMGSICPRSVRRWIIDPIDGTDPFLRGDRSWGTHLALEIDGQIKLAIITRPAELQGWWAVLGDGAWTSGTDDPLSRDVPLRVSTTSQLRKSRIGGFVHPDSLMAATVRTNATWVADPLGDLIGLLEGRVDAVVAPAGYTWDHAPQVLLTFEAGGRYTDRFGGVRADAGGGLYTNGLLDEQIQSIPELRPSSGVDSATWEPQPNLAQAHPRRCTEVNFGHKTAPDGILINLAEGSRAEGVSRRP